MENDEAKLLQTMVKEIVSEVDPETIVLFGSRARGEARADSDVDLLVIEKSPFTAERSRYHTAGRLYRRLAGLGVAKDLLLYSREEVDRLADSLNHIVGRALREGRVLYERRT